MPCRWDYDSSGANFELKKRMENVMTIRKLKKGFTLIELLVVIAIIGILAGLLLPNLAGVIDNAKATGMGSKARTITQAVIAENIERDALSLATIWPEDLAKRQTDAWNKADSNDYFAWLVAEDIGVKPAMFSGGGIATAPDNGELRTGTFNYNAWNIFWPGDGQTDKAVLSYFANGNPPFMVTRTYTGTSPTTGSRLTENDFDSGKPFGGKIIVVCFRDNTVLVTKQRNLTRDDSASSTFFNNPITTNSLAVSQAKYNE